jgi:hypothetical protein
MKKLPWLRLYTETVDDERLRLLAFEDRWHYIALLCLKGSGLLDAGDEAKMLQRKIAVKLGLQLRELEGVASRLGEVGLIDPATFQPTDWSAQQFISDTDPTAAERKRRQRKRGRLEKQQLARVTEASRVTVTDVTRTETDTDTDTETTTTNVGNLDWSFLPQFSHQEKVVVVEKLEGLGAEQQQDLLDELAGALRAKGIKGLWPAWLHTVIRRAHEGSFQPNHALTIRGERDRRISEVITAEQRKKEAAERAARLANPAAAARSKELADAAFAEARRL